MKHLHSKLLTALLLLLALPLPSAVAEEMAREQAEGYKVTGLVTDQTDQPLPGVTIIAKEDHKIACYSDVNGAFTLHIPYSRALTLQISYIGMIAQEVTVSPSNPSVKVRLKDDVELLGEVVVTGYQTLSKERATGSFSVIEPKALQEKLDVNLLDRLNGQVAGLVSTDNGLTLRGISTLRGNTRPLIVVNGMPYEGDLSAINPSTVKNITVLKDAAASSIYGARAANGVIVISTKQGSKESKPTFSYNGSVRFVTKPRMSALNLMDTREMLDHSLAVQQKFPLEIIPPADYKYYTSPIRLTILRYRHGEISEEELHGTLDRYAQLDNRSQLEEFYLRTGVEHQHNLALSGGSTNNRYMVTANYVGNNPTDKFSSSRRYGFTMRDDITLSDRFSIDIGLTGSYSDSKQDIGVGSFYRYYRTLPSYTMLLDADGTPLNIPGQRSEAELKRLVDEGLYDLHYSPLRNEGLELSTNHDSYYRINAGLTVNLLTGLNLSLRYSGDFSQDKSEQTHDPNSYGAMSEIVNAATKDPTSGEIVYNIPKGGKMIQVRGDGRAYTLRGQLDYTLEKGEHYLTALAGSEIRALKEMSTSVSHFGYDPNTLGFMPVDYNLLAEINGTYALSNYYSYDYHRDNYLYEREDRFVSFYGNASYSYAGKYDLTGSIRVDQSNLFGTDPRNQYRPLWSLGGMWHVNKEDFMQSTSDWLSNLVLRLTYGIGGNVPKDAGPFLTLTSPIYNPSNKGQFSKINNPPNPNLRWEKTATTNVGIDFGLLSNRLWGSLDFYNRHTTDLMADRTADPTLGWDKLLLNYGAMENRGVELTLSGAFRFGEVSYSPTLVLGINQNKLLNVEESNRTTFSYTQGNAITVGYPYLSVFSYPSAGLSPEDGTPLYYHTDPDSGERKVTAKVSEITMDDLVFSGSRMPTRTGSLTNRIEWRGFALSLMLYYSGGNVLRAVTAPYDGGSSGSNLPREYLNYWQKPGDEKDPTMTPAITGKPLRDTAVIHAWSASDLHAFPGDYLKVQDLSLSYTLPKDRIETLGLSTASLVLQLQNLGTISFNRRGYNAESMGFYSYGWGMRGIPSPLTISLGTTINF